jgi:hypothetical protein
MIKMAMILCWGLVPALASGTPPAASAAPPARENFGQYLVAHQDDLAPFFSKNKSELVRQSVPLVLEWMGKVLLVAFLIGWAIDILLGRGFAALFSPARATFRPALIYATGRLILNFILVASLGTTIVSVAGSDHLSSAILTLVAFFVLLGLVLQVGWIHFLFRADVPIAILFYLTLMVVHGFLTLAVSSSIGTSRASNSEMAFMDQTVTPQLQAEVKWERKKLAELEPARVQAAEKVARLQGQIDQTRTEVQEVQKQIDDAKISESYLYIQALKVHASGNLLAARDQFNALLARFPRGPLIGRVRGQLVQINSELAAQDAERKQFAATQTRQAARALAGLVARIGRGQATLSEMRRALIGKTRVEVSALLGSPSETASNRLGFGRQMILNPLTNQRSGLAVYFSEGTVQGVDYYYGKSASP